MSRFLERLERRALLSVSVNADGLMSIVGTSESDSIAVENRDGVLFVTINDQQSTFSSRTVRAIDIQGLGGGDAITVAPSVTQPVNINAGGGDGTVLRAGAGPTNLIAGDGNVVLVGGSGNDTFTGGTGNDTFVGGTGPDTMLGGVGDDVFFSGTGGGVMQGGTGYNTFATRTGVGDTVTGGAGFNAAEFNPKDTFSNIQYFFQAAPMQAPPAAPPPASPMLLTTNTSRLATRKTTSGKIRLAQNTTTTAATPTSTNPFQAALLQPVGGAPSASVQNGLLVVLGTTGTDTITVGQSGSGSSAVLTPVVNGANLGSFSASSIPNGVFINSGPGNDAVACVGALGNVTSFVYLYAGNSGADTLVGGAGDNYFNMGSRFTGNKVIGSFGPDTAIDFSRRLTGCRVALDNSPSGQLGTGEGDLINVPGAAIIYGSQGKDALFGNAANDNIFCDGAGTQIFGGSGALNSFDSGPGSDTVQGGGGQNTLYLRDTYADFYSTGGNPRSVLVTDALDQPLP